MLLNNHSNNDRILFETKVLTRILLFANHPPPSQEVILLIPFFS